MRTTLDLDEDVLQAAKELADPARCHRRKDVVRTSRAKRSRQRDLCRRSATACRCCHDSPGQRHHDDEAGQRAQRRGVSRVALLDVNVLVALSNPDHTITRSRTIGLPTITRAGGRPVRSRRTASYAFCANPRHETVTFRPAELRQHLLRRFCCSQASRVLA